MTVFWLADLTAVALYLAQASMYVFYLLSVAWLVNSMATAAHRFLDVFVLVWF